MSVPQTLKALYEMGSLQLETSLTWLSIPQQQCTTGKIPFPMEQWSTGQNAI